MIRVLLLLVVVGLVTFALHRRLVRATGLAGRWAMAANTALFVLGLLSLIAFQVGDSLDPSWARPLGFVGFTWGVVALYLLMGIAVLGIVNLLARVVRGSALPTRVFNTATALVAVVAVSLTGYGLVEAASPRIVETTATIQRLPAAFVDARIALITDLHAGPARGAGFVQGVVDQVNAAEPDLVVLSGDLVDGTVAKVGADLAPLRDVDAPLGVFAVSGNHEYYANDGGPWLDFWETLGITVLRNQRAELRRGSDVLEIAGVYDATAPAPYEPDYAAALAGRDTARPVILLAHQPKQAFDAAKYGADLQLSGHTHGGQIWPFTHLVSLAQPVSAGWANLDGVSVYVTRGAGAWGPPVRVAAPPEITLLTLRAA